jgi:hypothetical protein
MLMVSAGVVVGVVSRASFGDVTSVGDVVLVLV